MTGPFSTFLRDGRQRAREEAERYLLAEGYSSGEGGRWTGPAALADGPAATLTVSLPDDFPDRLPDVFVPAEVRDAVRAHVERSGKLCVAPDGGVLIDPADGSRVVRDTLARATRLLTPAGDAGQGEIEEEFNAYWYAPKDGTLLSLIPPDAASGETWVAAVNHPAFTHIVAASKDQVQRWAAVTSSQVGRICRGYHLRLPRIPAPPTYDGAVSYSEFLALASESENGGADRFRSWIAGQRLPVTVTLAAAMSSGPASAVFAVVVPMPKGGSLQLAQRGFRPGRAPAWRLLACARDEPLIRPEVARADPDYALQRAGAHPPLRNKKVVVLGCGAVGSHLASFLASSGVGKLLLVDHETLVTANLHRHLLGAESLGRDKVEALRESLHRRFPELEIAVYAKTVQVVLDEHPDDLADADLVAVALGDETLERRLNEYFASRVFRVHTWLEPLGLGGHVLACGVPGQRGCLDCLYRRDEEHGVVNMASLAAPGQMFRRAMGGCAGTFTPYGITDAVQAAAEATREVVRLLTDAPTPRLTSWVADRAAFEREGYRVSHRATLLPAGAVNPVENFSRADCPVCGGDSP